MKLILGLKSLEDVFTELFARLQDFLCCLVQPSVSLCANLY